MPPVTTAHRLADALLGGDGKTEQLIRGLRAEGCSWRTCSLELHRATSGSVDIAPETLRLWFAEPAATP